MAGDSPLPRRLGIAALCLLALAASVALAWWQWDRFQSSSGTFQNLGYVLQWPLFGVFPAFMVWRWRRLRQQEERTAGEPVQRREPVRPAPPRPAPPQPASPQPEPDDDLAAYNRFLAELNARDQQESR